MEGKLEAEDSPQRCPMERVESCGKNPPPKQHLPDRSRRLLPGKRKEAAAMSNWHSMEVDQVLKELNTDPHQGLSVEEARSRLEKYGYNEVKRKEHLVSPSTLFRYRLKNTLIIILVIAAVLSVFIPPLFRISIPAYLIAWFR